MSDSLVKAEHYRYRAEELRAIAQDHIDADCVTMLENVALQYETLADDLEKSAKRDGLKHK